MLEDVGGDDRVVRPVLVDGGRDAVLEVADDEVIEAPLGLRRVAHVDADDVVAQLAQRLAEPAAAAAEVEHPPGRPGADQRQQLGVARSAVGLPLVLGCLGAGQRRSEADAGEPVADHVGRDVAGVGEAVDVADLVAVVGGDGDLGDALAVGVHLQQDLGVEVEAVAVGLERDRRQRRHRQGPIAAVPLAEREPGDGVLDAGEHPVADVLVQRHPTLAGVAAGHHPGAEDHLGVAAHDRLDDIGQQLGGVLAVTVEQHDDVEAVLDGPAVAELLVAAVAEVAGLADDRQRQPGLPLLVLQAHRLRVVVGVVVADEDRRDARAEALRDPVEDPGQRRRRVVGDDHDADARTRGHSARQGTAPSQQGQGAPGRAWDGRIRELFAGTAGSRPHPQRVDGSGQRRGVSRSGRRSRRAACPPRG